MKKILSIAILMIFALSMSAQETVTPEKPKKVKEPEITFETLVHDYGQIFQNDNGECEFVELLNCLMIKWTDESGEGLMMDKMSNCQLVALQSKTADKTSAVG